MDEHELSRRITSLQSRMNRMEALMEQLLHTLTSSQAHIDQYRRMQAMLQELREGPTTQSVTRGSDTRQPPEMVAIRQALLAGERLKAIQLYRSLYGVGLKEAMEALDRL